MTLVRKIIFVIATFFCLSPYGSSAIALILGVAFALTLGNPWSEFTKAATPRLLTASVIGLGAGMNLVTVAQVGVSGIGYTLISIVLAFVVGLSLAKLLKIEENTGLLVTVGTAICGGSAIAAVSPVLRAKPHEMSVALGIVFLLNACALMIFPPVGHAFQLSESQFGLWAALSIHDTSSVVGASMQYGRHALEVGTTVKLARALWIVPVTFAFGVYISKYRAAEGGVRAKPKKPWFILGFLIMAAIATWVPGTAEISFVIEFIAKHALVLTLFLIGTNLTPATLKAVGVRPFLQGLGLWLVIAASTLFVIVQGWIHT